MAKAEDKIKIRISRYYRYSSMYLVSFRFPIKLDFNDKDAKDLIYKTWSKEQNVPNLYPEIREQITKLKNLKSYFKIPLKGIVLGNCDEGSYILVSLDSSKNYTDIIKTLNEIFPNSECYKSY